MVRLCTLRPQRALTDGPQGSTQIGGDIDVIAFHKFDVSVVD